MSVTTASAIQPQRMSRSSAPNSLSSEPFSTHVREPKETAKHTSKRSVLRRVKLYCSVLVFEAEFRGEATGERMLQNLFGELPFTLFEVDQVDGVGQDIARLASAEG